MILVYVCSKRRKVRERRGSGEKCEGELSVSTDRDVGAEMRKLTRQKYAIILKVCRGESMQVIWLAARSFQICSRNEKPTDEEVASPFSPPHSFPFPFPPPACIATKSNHSCSSASDIFESSLSAHATILHRQFEVEAPYQPRKAGKRQVLTRPRPSLVCPPTPIISCLRINAISFPYTLFPLQLFSSILVSLHLFDGSSTTRLPVLDFDGFVELNSSLEHHLPSFQRCCESMISSLVSALTGV